MFPFPYYTFYKLYVEVNCFNTWSLYVADQLTTRNTINIFCKTKVYIFNSSKWSSATQPLQTNSPTFPPLRILKPYILHPPPNSSPIHPPLLPQPWGDHIVHRYHQKKFSLLLASSISLLTPRQSRIITLVKTQVITTCAPWLPSRFSFSGSVYSCLSIIDHCNMRTQFTCISRV